MTDIEEIVTLARTLRAGALASLENVPDEKRAGRLVSVQAADIIIICNAYLAASPAS